MRVAVIGAGSWGTAVAGIAAHNSDAVLWARRPALADATTADNENADYLPGLTLPDDLRATASLEEACAGADAVVMGVPSHGFRDVIAAAAPSIRADAAVISLSKGIEQGTLARMTEVIADVLESHPRDRIGVLSGP